MFVVVPSARRSRPAVRPASAARRTRAGGIDIPETFLESVVAPQAAADRESGFEDAVDGLPRDDLTVFESRAAS